MSDRARKLGWVGPRDRYWEWILSRLGPVEFLALDSQRGEDFRPWLNESEANVLLMGIEDRYSPEAQAFESLHTETPPVDPPKKRNSKSTELTTSSQSRTLGILGEAWEGHRRTHPVGEHGEKFYWYELYDRLLPTLDSRNSYQAAKSPQAKSNASNTSAQRSLRVQRWIELSTQFQAGILHSKRCMVIADSNTTAELWSCVLETMGSSVLVTESGQGARARFQPDFVVLDLDEPPRQSSRHVDGLPSKSERIGQELNWIGRRFPDALTIVADGFPRWSDWSAWTNLGADVLLPRPFCSFGVSWASQRWSESANQVPSL
jgi:CheY-like chemotaxis protein